MPSPSFSSEWIRGAPQISSVSAWICRIRSASLWSASSRALGGRRFQA
jgi:hypothetical protein